MPELGGPELIERLRERVAGDPKVIYMSGYVDSRLAQRGLSENALLLRKPFDPEQLQQTIRDLLAP